MDLTRAFAERGDLAHLALFLWASGSSALLAVTVRALVRQLALFEAFVGEISRLNDRLRGPDDGGG